MLEMWVRSLGQEDPLEEGMATHFSIPAWRIPWSEEHDWLQSIGSQRIGHDWSNLVAQSCPTLSDPMDCSLCLWNSPGKNTGVGSHYLLQGIFLTQRSNPGLSHCRQILYHLSHEGSPWKMMLWKCCTQYICKFGKLSSGHRTGKGQFSLQSQRKAMPKTAQTPHNCTHLSY